MTNKIYIGNLSYRTAEDQLSQHFTKFGTISSTVIVIDRATNRSKGFGFITFDKEEAAQQAVQEMNGKEIDGRTVKVSIAKPPKEREGGGGGGGAGGGGRRPGGGFGGGRREGGFGGGDRGGDRGDRGDRGGSGGRRGSF